MVIDIKYLNIDENNINYCTEKNGCLELISRCLTMYIPYMFICNI